MKPISLLILFVFVSSSTFVYDGYAAYINDNGVGTLYIYTINNGKTTILKALEFFREIVLNPEDKKTETFNFKPFLFDNISSKLNTPL